MQFVALQSGREESLPSIGREKMEEHRKEREQKRKRHVYRVISGQTEKTEVTAK